MNSVDDPVPEDIKEELEGAISTLVDLVGLPGAVSPRTRNARLVEWAKSHMPDSAAAQAPVLKEENNNKTSATKSSSNATQLGSNAAPMPHSAPVDKLLDQDDEPQVTPVEEERQLESVTRKSGKACQHNPALVFNPMFMRMYVVSDWSSDRSRCYALASNMWVRAKRMPTARPQLAEPAHRRLLPDLASAYYVHEAKVPNVEGHKGSLTDVQKANLERWIKDVPRPPCSFCGAPTLNRSRCGKTFTCAQCEEGLLTPWAPCCRMCK